MLWKETLMKEKDEDNIVQENEDGGGGGERRGRVRGRAGYECS